MFGYININREELSDENKKRIRHITAVSAGN